LERMRVFYELRPETVVLERQVREMIEKERGERLDDDAFKQAVYRRILEGGAASEAKDRAPYQVAVTTCIECKRGWQDGGGETVEMSPAAVETALCDAEHIGSLDGESADRAKQDVPPAMRRKVKARDHHKCRVPGCRSSRNLDVHHIIHREHGGTHEIENLICLCEGHHLAHHKGSLLIEGPASSAKITKRAHNSFAIAERAIETAKALRASGFDKREVKAAMDRTRAHVGTEPHSLEQWIKIALSYCPKPRTG